MKRLILKNVIITGIIILVACFFTYKIYNRFHTEGSIDYSSSSLDITFHEKSDEFSDRRHSAESIQSCADHGSSSGRRVYRDAGFSVRQS